MGKKKIHFDETEYLLSSKANKERLESAIKDFTESRDRIVDHLSRELDIDNSSNLEGQEADFSRNTRYKEPTVITPVSLLNLGFTEEYQHLLMMMMGSTYSWMIIPR